MKRSVAIVFLFIFSQLCFPFVSQAALLDTYASLKTKYASGGPVRILLVPGHDDEFYGTSYDGVREADLTMQLARGIAGYLSQDPKIEITLARDESGYNKDFLNYSIANALRVMKNVSVQSTATQQAIENGSILVDEQVPHANATSTVVQRLYTLNSWIDAQAFDLVLHIHFNDYGGRYSDREGRYSGFSIYVPDSKLQNATTSKIFGDVIGKRLMQTLYKSNQISEKKQADKYGAIPDFYLIAMGSYNSVQAPRALVEYSYIYEPQLQGDFFAVTGNMLARGTSFAIGDFLSGKNSTSRTSLDYFWQKNLLVSKKPSSDVLALQYALSELGFYPPANSTRTSCPFNGIFGKCTTKALTSFQISHKITPTGTAGPATRATLSNIFSDE